MSPDGLGGQASGGCFNKGTLCFSAETRLVPHEQEERGEGEHNGAQCVRKASPQRV